MAEIAKRGTLTTEQAQQLAQIFLETAPGSGTAESLMQLITGQSSLTGEEANRFWAAVGVVPIVGGVFKKVGEPAVEAIGKVVKEVISNGPSAITLSKAKFGHTFSTHGQDATDFLVNRAAGSGRPTGQFLDDQVAAQFILQNLDKLKGRSVSLPIPDNFPARVIMPDGTFVSARTIRIVPGSNGVRTAYPEP